MPAMSIGQIAEIATMASLGFFLARLGWRRTMVFGILGHVVRFLFYAVGRPVWLVVGSNIVHGFCYAFFFASVCIFGPEQSPQDAPSTAHAPFTFPIPSLACF